MGTTFKELKRLVTLNLRQVDGITQLALEDGINQAQKNIARVKDFDELFALDTTNASTAIGVKTYHLINDLHLTRPKDIYTIRYMDDTNSRKLIYVSASKMDRMIPYPEQFSNGRPVWYVRRGMNIDLIRIPDAIKPLYIYYSQWPELLSNDTDETPYLNIDDIIVTLASEITSAILSSGSGGDWSQRASTLLGLVTNEERTRPDNVFIAQPFCIDDVPPLGEYWLNPFIRKNPE